jgi:transcriptional regulator with XRE-family HTH domain
MAIAQNPEVPTPLRSLAEALGEALVSANSEAVITVLEKAFRDDPALAASRDVQEGLKAGAAMALDGSSLPPAAAKWLANLTENPTMPAALKTIRQALGMTTAALGKHLGVSQVTVTHWETGTSKMSERALCALIRLAKKKGVDVTNPGPRKVSGNALRRLRLSTGLTQTEMGERLGLSRDAIALYEGRAEPPARCLERMAAFEASLRDEQAAA